MTGILRPGALYFTLVFGAGFLLGVPRVLWLVPRVGERWAELLEMPLMLGVIIFAARWIVRRSCPGTAARLGIGITALALLLAAEFTLVLGLRGLTLAGYFATRDPVSGAAYCVMLGLFAVMPLLVARR